MIFLRVYDILTGIAVFEMMSIHAGAKRAVRLKMETRQKACLKPRVA